MLNLSSDWVSVPNLEQQGLEVHVAVEGFLGDRMLPQHAGKALTA